MGEGVRVALFGLDTAGPDCTPLTALAFLLLSPTIHLAKTTGQGR